MDPTGFVSICSSFLGECSLSKLGTTAITAVAPVLGTAAFTKVMETISHKKSMLTEIDLFYKTNSLFKKQLDKLNEIHSRYRLAICNLEDMYNIYNKNKDLLKEMKDNNKIISETTRLFYREEMQYRLNYINTFFKNINSQYFYILKEIDYIETIQDPLRKQKKYKQLSDKLICYVENFQE